MPDDSRAEGIITEHPHNIIASECLVFAVMAGQLLLFQKLPAIHDLRFDNSSFVFLIRGWPG